MINTSMSFILASAIGHCHNSLCNIKKFKEVQLSMTKDFTWYFITMTSLSAIHCGDKFYANRKVGTGRSGWVYTEGAVNLLANVAGCRKVLVGIGWANSWFTAFVQMGLENVLITFVWAPFLALKACLVWIGIGWSKTVASQGEVVKVCIAPNGWKNLR